MKNLGYANGWRETPPELTRCSDLNHAITTVEDGRCVNRHSCEPCQIEWRVDSSD